MDAAGFDLVCPACGGALAYSTVAQGAAVSALPPASGAADQDGRLDCASCPRQYPVILGIPDLRLWPDPYIGFEEDRAKGRMLEEACRGLDFATSIELYYRKTTAVPPFQARRFARSLLAAADRAAQLLHELDADSPPRNDVDALLDLGCGTAPLLLAARRGARRALGVDVAFRWLILARKRLEEAGVSAPLVCACAEALPFRGGTFADVFADSVVEHLRDQPAALQQCRRVLCAGGRIFLATPNQRSLGPDPHTGLPAGGWLPDAVTAAYVRRKGGIPPQRRLLRARTLRNDLARAGFVDIEIAPPAIAAAQRASFGAAARAAIDAYELFRTLPGGSAVLRAVGPLLHATARKPDTMP